MMSKRTSPTFAGSDYSGLLPGYIAFNVGRCQRAG